MLLLVSCFFVCFFFHISPSLLCCRFFSRAFLSFTFIIHNSVYQSELVWAFSAVYPHGSFLNRSLDCVFQVDGRGVFTGIQIRSVNSRSAGWGGSQLSKEEGLYSREMAAQCISVLLVHSVSSLLSLASVMEAWDYLKLCCISLPSLSTLIRGSVGMLPAFFREQFQLPSSSVVLSVVPDQQQPRNHLGTCYKCKFSAPPQTY